jgi:predicted O-linked N-acetylglucosamine transferase (SPINDLY family)
MMGMDIYSGYFRAVDIPTYLAIKDQIMELRLQLLSKENEIARLQDRLEDLQRKHEQDLASAKNPQELIKQVAPSILGAVQGLDLSSFGKKPQAPMNGVDTMEKPTNTQNKQALMVQAVNKLINLDPNFSDNICKLAELAERNPTVYKMAVNQLNSL